MKYDTGLYIGRFQPFHNGHLEVIKKAMSMVGDLRIVVGSAQAKNTWYNPFSYKERVDMIYKTVRAWDRKKAWCIDIMPLDDIDDPGAWANYVVNNVGSIDVLFSGNLDGVVTLFRKSFTDIDIVMFGGQRTSGTQIRENIAMGKRWEQSVSEETEKVIKRCKGEDRIFRIYHNMKERK